MTYWPAFARSDAVITDERLFSIDDYFKIWRVAELALSSDGTMVAYAVERQSLEENKPVRVIYVSRAIPNAIPIPVPEIQHAKNLTWIPGTQKLAFLLKRGGSTQVYSIDTENIDTENKDLHQHTHEEDRSVVQFAFSADGNSLVWLTQENVDYLSARLKYRKLSDVYAQLADGEEGILIDTENTSITAFVNPDAPSFVNYERNALRLKLADKRPSKIEIPGIVRAFHWSADGSKLSITYVDNSIPRDVFFFRHTSVGIFDIAAERFRIVAPAVVASNASSVITYYSGGEWVPNKDAIVLRRTVTEEDHYMQEYSWALMKLTDKRKIGSLDWREIEFYSLNPSPEFIRAGSNAIYSNRYVRARQHLYRIDAPQLQRADILRDVNGSVSYLRFSADFSAAAFVNESLSQPPEIYIWRKACGVQQTTRINQDVANTLLPYVREVTWRSEDGATVQGWLLLPPIKDREHKAWPVITFVHGGPATAFPDKFAPYFNTWPYPFEAYALNGMAVFIPNYRGTSTFGSEFSYPIAPDGEPIDDIASGIAHLVKIGIADPERLAIAGHSHGAWLAPLAMTRAKLFRVASFAEQNGNKVLVYFLAPRFLTKHVLDRRFGSFYDNPQRYFEVSPDLHFKGLDTAVLYEAGARSIAMTMFASAKAAIRAGMPSEFVVYPRTGHNIRMPKLQRESAQRNLDWFRFWLLHEEDPNTDDPEQYIRWRQLKASGNASVLSDYN